MKRTICLFLSLLLLCAAPLALAEVTAFTYENNGRIIPAIYTAPDDVAADTPIVVMCHGHGGSKDENVGYVEIANALAAAGIASIRMDYPGCGESPEPFTSNTLTNMISDTMAGLASAKEIHGEGEYALGILGYSMGGRIATTIVGQEDNPFSALALLAGSTDKGDGLFNNGFFGDWEALYKTAKENGYVDFTTVFGQQQQLSKEFFEDLLVSSPMENNPFEGDLLVMHGTEDTIVGEDVYNATIAAFEGKVNSLTSVTFEGADHGYGFYSDQDALRKQVTDTIVTFFADMLLK